MLVIARWAPSCRASPRPLSTQEGERLFPGEGAGERLTGTRAGSSITRLPAGLSLPQTRSWCMNLLRPGPLSGNPVLGRRGDFRDPLPCPPQCSIVGSQFDTFTFFNHRHSHLWTCDEGRQQLISVPIVTDKETEAQGAQVTCSSLPSLVTNGPQAPAVLSKQGLASSETSAGHLVC